MFKDSSSRYTRLPNHKPKYFWGFYVTKLAINYSCFNFCSTQNLRRFFSNFSLVLHEKFFGLVSSKDGKPQTRNFWMQELYFTLKFIKDIWIGYVIIYYSAPQTFWASSKKGNFDSLERKLFDSLKRDILTVWKGKFWQFGKGNFDSLERKILTVWKGAQFGDLLK